MTVRARFEPSPHLDTVTDSTYIPSIHVDVIGVGSGQIPECWLYKKKIIIKLLVTEESGRIGGVAHPCGWMEKMETRIGGLDNVVDSDYDSIVGMRRFRKWLHYRL